MKPLKNNLSIGIFVFFFLFCFLFPIVDTKMPERKIVTPDTLIVRKPVEAPILTKNIDVPVKVIVKKKPNKQVRDSIVEKRDIITWVRYRKPFLKPYQIEITKIDTLGLQSTAIYNASDISSFDMDGTGKIKTTKKKRLIKKILIVGGSAIAISVAGKIAYDKYIKTTNK